MAVLFTSFDPGDFLNERPRSSWRSCARFIENFFFFFDSFFFFFVFFLSMADDHEEEVEGWMAECDEKNIRRI